MDRRALLALLLAAALLVAGAIAFADFHAMESETRTDSAVSTARVNDATAPKTDLTLVVLGDGPLTDRLGPALETALSDTWGSVTLVEMEGGADGLETEGGAAGIETVDTDGGPVLVVGLEETSVQYNPITPSARVRVAFGFVGSGNATLASQFAAGETPMVKGNENRYVVYGTVTVADRSRGVVSQPAYRRHLAEGLSTSLEGALTSAPGM